MTSPPSTRPGLRDRTRDAVRAQIAEVAVDLFSERGFDGVTVEEIAAAVGISARSFHRYFPAKEDAVVGDPLPWGEFVRDAFAARPVDEPVWDSLRESFDALLAASGEQGERQKRALRVLTGTASLRARHLEKHLLWESLLVPLIGARLEGSDTSLRARVVAQAGIVCFDAAITGWALPGETRSVRVLLATTFEQFVLSPSIR